MDADSDGVPLITLISLSATIGAIPSALPYSMATKIFAGDFWNAFGIMFASARTEA